MGITTDQILTTTIQINSSDIFRTRNIDGIILHKLKKFEEKCIKMVLSLKIQLNL